MDDFNDFYNRFIASHYGVNVLSYLFFITAFFSLILYLVLGILIRYQNKDVDNIYVTDASSKPNNNNAGYGKPATD